MTTKTKYFTIVIILTLFIFVGCTKMDEWLDIKRQKEQVSPETLKDFQAILDDFFSIHNVFGSFGLVGSDDVYLTDEGYAASSEIDQNAYIWNKNIWSDDNSQFWNYPYAIIFRSNVVLDGLVKLRPNNGEQPDYNDIKGQALFYRSISYYNLAQLFCKPFSKATANTDLGLPLKLTSDANIVENRALLSATYDQILKDAKEAVRLLPTNSLNSRRPNKAAGFALLAKTNLIMQDYEQAKNYADSALQLNGILLDFNNDYISTSLTNRFPYEPYDHPEILFYAQGAGARTVSPSTRSLGIVDSVLYEEYHEYDLRKIIFFSLQDDLPKYRGTYTGSNSNFCGISTNEIYLIRSECNARLNEVPSAINDLNTLLQHRYLTGKFTNYSVTNKDEALDLILMERRKELIGVSNIRWEDIRRLNQEDKFQITQKRIINGKTFILLPNDNKYILPIPDYELQLSGIEQNPR